MQIRQFIRHPVDIPIQVSRLELGHSEQELLVHSNRYGRDGFPMQQQDGTGNGGAFAHFLSGA
jgi:hypothetical protein